MVLTQLITLNIWCGKLFNKVIDFVKEKSKDTDVFCFQEVLDNKKGVQSAIFKDGKEDIVSIMKDVLPEFSGYSAIPQKNERGLATFIKKSWKVEEVGEQFVYGAKESMVNNNWQTIGINTLYTKISNGSTYKIWNLHGAFVAPDKKDYPKTLEQSNNLKRIIEGKSGARILCGDFNLEPNTESIGILESIPLRNLVKDYKIVSTRTIYYDFPEKYADYIMPSNEVKVNDFKVLDDVVSDHSPLLLDCE